MFFMFGVCIYYLTNIRFKFFTSIGVLVTFCLILWAQTESQTSDYLLIASLVAFAAFCDQIRVFQRLKPLRRFGDLSYSVFLWHIPIQLCAKLAQAKFSIDNSIAYNKLFFIFFIALTYCVGFLSYRFIEQPAQRIIRKQFARTATI
jgi:peptidoglycan/LPS O-acetylase OafA/YrhL